MTEIPSDTRNPQFSENFSREMKAFHMSVLREEDTLRISAFERSTMDEELTIHDYEKIEAPMSRINKSCNDLVKTLNEANRKGRVTADIYCRILEIGQMFYDDIFPQNIKDKLKHTNAPFLRLSLDDRLVHIPWELLYDGKQFLCRRFCMGRLVTTGRKLPDLQYRKMTQPLNMLIIADPEKNLTGAYTEGTTIRDYMDQQGEAVRTTLLSGNVSVDMIREKLRNFDLIHFAGHVNYHQDNQKQSGWRLSNGLLKTEDIVIMAGSLNMPSLVFSNACQSARTKEWKLADDFQDEISALANAFLYGGVRHYIGTFWEILDKPSVYFASAFYQLLINGIPIGMAIRDARQYTIDKFGKETIVWASYLLYGDPVTCYLPQTKAIEAAISNPEKNDQMSSLDTRSVSEDIISLSENTRRQNKTNYHKFFNIALILLAILILLVGYSVVHKQFNTDQHNEMQTATNARNAHLVQADEAFLKGDLDVAEELYRKAFKTIALSDNDHAEALIMLGRIASIENRYPQALDYYTKAARTSPANNTAHISKAMLFEKKGDYDQALAEIKTAASLSPNDPGIRMLAIEISEKIAKEQDIKQQAYIDTQIDDLIKRAKENKIPSQKVEPLRVPTIWVMDFQSSGYGLIEGEARFLATCMITRLSKNIKAEFVDRTILNKLLSELKLGNSEITDPSVMLTIGNVIAAQYIITGRIVHDHQSTMVSCRMIETETTRVKKAVSEIFSSTATPNEISEKIIRDLLSDIDILKSKNI